MFCALKEHFQETGFPVIFIKIKKTNPITYYIQFLFPI